MEEKQMIFTVIALVIGAAILCGGLYYLAKEKEDRESRKIYIITAVVGAVILAGAILMALR